jgi:hypothetical protein
VDIAFGIVRFPCIILVEGSVEIEEVREETPCTHLAGILIEVIVSVLGEIADASFFLPNLDREDSGRAVADAFVCSIKDFADDAATFCGSVCTIVD